MPHERQPALFPRRRLVARVPDAARFYGVTARTVRAWIARGAIPIERTPGGGVRIVDEKVLEAMKSDEDRG